mgnify:CR=1 FL=1|tara:strand:+ start:11975 stop:12772 length:798 start_codon:yes stop_codon:yes gene_type:complete
MDINLTIPQKWNDLSFVQLRNVVHQFHCYQQIIKDNAEAVAETSFYLSLQLSKELIRGNSWKSVKIALNEIQPKAYIPWVQFLYDRIDRTKFIPFVEIEKVKYFAPGQRLRNITIGEFSFADAVFYKWRQTKNDIWLSVLCATLYRERAKEPNEIDNRTPYIKQAVDTRADEFEKLDLKTKLAIAYTYEGCRNHIADTFPLIFPKPVEIEGQTKPQPKKYVSFGEIVLDKINGDPSKLNETNKVFMYDFLSIVQNDIKNLRKSKK